jgi:hypothetical protein
VKYIELNTSYRLYAFPGYSTMQAAKISMKRAVLAKEFSKVKEIEVKKFVRSVGSTGYKNYLRTETQDLKGTGLAYLITAIQILYKINQNSGKYIIIEGRY